MSQARDHAEHHWPVRPLRKRVAAGTPVMPVLLVSGIVSVDLLGGPGMLWLPLLATGPALAASTNGPRGVLCVGILAGVLCATLGTGHGVSGRELAVILSADGTVRT